MRVVSLLLCSWIFVVGTTTTTTTTTTAAAAAASTGDDGVVEDTNEFVVSGYFPDYRSYINLNNTVEYLTDVVLFSIEPNIHTFDPYDVSQTCCLQHYHFQQARDARDYKQQQHNKEPLKLWLTIGGAGRSAGFHEIVTQEDSKQTFITKLIQLCKKEEIDGVDFDWELPQSDEEHRYYYYFLHTAIPKLHAEHILVSVALHPHQFLPHFLYQDLDRIHLMTYDMMYYSSPNPKQQQQQQHHGSSSQMKLAIHQLIQASGCPPSKIVVGIPAYARHERNANHVKTYAEIVDEIQKDQGEEYIQTTLLTAVQEYRNIRHPEGKKEDKDTIVENYKGYIYDSLLGIQKKVHYASKVKQLRGIFFWELGQDKQYEPGAPAGILLQTAGNIRNEYVKEVEASKRQNQEL